MLFKYLTPITGRVCRSFSHTWTETCNQNRPPERQKQPNGNDAPAEASPPCVRTYLQISVNIHSHSVHWI